VPSTAIIVSRDLLHGPCRLFWSASAVRNYRNAWVHWYSRHHCANTCALNSHTALDRRETNCRQTWCRADLFGLLSRRLLSFFRPHARVKKFSCSFYSVLQRGLRLKCVGVFSVSFFFHVASLKRQLSVSRISYLRHAPSPTQRLFLQLDHGFDVRRFFLYITLNGIPVAPRTFQD